MEPFSELIFGAVRLADLVDILLVAVLFFLAITWMRRTQTGSAARRLMALVLVYALVYLAADLFDLYLMRRVLGVLFFVVLIALVVIFQGDMRRLLDRLGSWHAGGRRESTVPGSPVERLQEAAMHLAKERIGALIAIRGSEPWQSHLHGGIELDGKLSRPLLYSIFQPDSPGHDGAVIVEEDRITRFAVHLPLATRLPEASRYGGTRHSAGLGLAEQCDALVIVVSEERGTISLAEDGELIEVASPSELTERLQRFWNRHHAPRSSGRREWFSRRSAETAGLSVGLAVVTWFVFVYSADTVSRTYRAPIEIRNLPPEWRVENNSVPPALLTLSGSEQAFERLQPDELAVSVDLADPKPGRNQVTITEQALSLPSGIRLTAADPPTVSVQAQRQQRVSVPVQIRTTGPVPEGFRLVSSPRAVEVLVPEEMRADLAAISTEPVDVRGLSTTRAARVRLMLPAEMRLAPDQDAEVEVRLRRASASP